MVMSVYAVILSSLVGYFIVHSFNCNQAANRPCAQLMKRVNLTILVAYYSLRPIV